VADNVVLPGEGQSVATDDVGGAQYQRVKLDVGGDGVSVPVVGSLPVSGPLTDAQLRAAAVPVSGTFWQATQPVSGPVTDAQIRATPIGVTVSNFPGTQAVSAASLPLPTGAAAESTLSAINVKTPSLGQSNLAGSVPVAIASDQSAIPVTVSNFPGTQAVSGPLTDAELRATPVTVSGPLTDAQLRASAVPVSLAGVASETTLATLAAATKLEDTPGASGDRGMLVFGQRQDADTTSVSDNGDYTVFKMDEAGRLKVASQPGLSPLSTGSITANGQTVAVSVARQSNIMVHMVATSLVGHNATFEGSIDSTNGTDGAWFALQAVRSNANTIELATGVLAATPAYGWELSVNGLAWFRVRATAHTSGTALWKVQPAPFATEPIPAQQVSGTQPISGSITATLAASNVRAGFFGAAGIWYDDSSTALAANASFTGTSRDATVTATATAHANAATYAKEVRACAESDQSGTLWLEVSRDNVNWRRIRSVATVAITGGGQAAEIVYQPSWRYWRIGFTNGATLQARFTIGTMALAI